MMDDKEKMRPWICQSCEFVNCKLKVDGLWRYYNQANKCGLCGDSRHEILNDIKDDEQPRRHLRRRNTMAFSAFKTYQSQLNATQQPIIDTEKWDEIDDSECTLFKSPKHLSHNQLVYLLQNYFFNQITKPAMKTLLLKYKDTIIEYFTNKKIDGKQFVAMKKRTFTKEIK
eukprot:715789_1